MLPSNDPLYYFMYFIAHVFSAAYIQPNDDSVFYSLLLSHVNDPKVWDVCSPASMQSCIIIQKSALTVIWCQIGLIFTSKRHALCRSKCSDNFQCDRTSRWCLPLHFGVFLLFLCRDRVPISNKHTLNIQNIHTLFSFSCCSVLAVITRGWMSPDNMFIYLDSFYSFLVGWLTLHWDTDSNVNNSIRNSFYLSNWALLGGINCR